MDRLLLPANRQHLPPDKQLQQLLEKLDLTCSMKSSPSRSKRLKLLKKTINDVRSEMSLSRVVPSAHHPPSSTPTSTPAHPEPSAAADKEKSKSNGHFTDDEGTFQYCWNSDTLTLTLFRNGLNPFLWLLSNSVCIFFPKTQIRDAKTNFN